MAKTVAELRKERDSGKYNVTGSRSVKKTKTVAELRKERDSGKYNIIIDESVKKSQNYEEQIRQKKIQRITQSNKNSPLKTALEGLPENPSYSDINTRLSELNNLRGGAKRRGGDTKKYEEEIDVLNSYMASFLSTTDKDDDSVSNRKGAYDYLKRQFDSQKEAYSSIKNQLSKDERKEREQILDNLEISLNLYKRSEISKYDDYSYFRKAPDFEENSDNKRKSSTDLNGLPTPSNHNYSDRELDRKNNIEEFLNQNKSKDEETLKDPLATYEAQRNASDRGQADFLKDIVYPTVLGSKEEIKDNEQVVSLSGKLKNWDYLLEDERDMYYYLLNKMGPEAAQGYLDDLQVILDKRYTTELTTDIQSQAKENPLKAAALSAVSVPSSVVGGAISFVDNAIGLADEILYDTEGGFNPYSRANTLSSFSQAVRGSVGEAIDEKTQGLNLLGFTLGDAYQALMSGGDSMLSALTLRGKAMLPLAGAAGSARAKQLYEQGESMEEIALGATSAAVFEALFEKIGLDNLMKITDVNTIGKFIVKTLGQAGIEAGEEVGTEIFNNLFDLYRRRERSDLMIDAEKFIEQGYSKNSALGIALAQKAYEAGMGGFISGGGMGSVASGSSLVENTRRNKLIGAQIASQGNAEVAINKALNLPDTSSNAKIKKLAQDIQNTDTSKLSKTQASKYNKKLGQLYEMLQTSSVSDVVNSSDVAVKDVIKQKLTEYGVTERTDDIASAIYKQFKGQETNDIDRGLIKANYGDEIITYLNDNKSEVGETVASRISESYRNFDSVKGLLGIEEIPDIDIEDFNLSDDGKTYIAGTSNAVEVGKIETISKDDIVVSLSDGSEESVKNLDLGSSEQAVLYQGILDIQSDLGVKLDTSTANALVTAYNNMNTDAKTYVMDAKVAIMKGYANVGANTLKTNVLGDKTRIIYDLGVKLSENETARRKKAVANKVAPKNKSTVTFEDVDRNNLTELQRVSVNAVEKLAESTGVNFVFFRSEKENGKYTSKYDTEKGSPNGFYKASINTVYLDINAGATGKGTILFTAGHELAHEIREWSPESFKTFADFLAEKYTAKGENFDALIRAKMQQLDLTYDEAYEEVVADSCESFLIDSNLIENVEELSKRDMNLATKIKDFLKNLLQKVREVYKKLSPDSYEGKYVREMRDSLSELHGKWIQGIKNATENLNNAKTGATKNTANNDGVKFQPRVTDSDIKTLHNIAQAKGKISINNFNAQEIRATEKWARKFYQELGVKSPYFRAWFGDWRAYDTKFAYTTSISNKVNMTFDNRTVRNSDTKWNIQVTKDVFGDSLHYAGKQKLYIERLLTDIDDVLQKAILLDTSISEKNTANKKGSTQFMHYLYSIIEYNGNPFLAKFTVEEYGTNGNKRAYNVQRIKMSTLSRAQYSQIKSAYRGKFASNVDAITIADLHSLVKQYDKNFNPKPVNKILLNDDGTPKVFYHGTNADFTVFDVKESGKNYGDTSTGLMFFTNKKSGYQDSASDYANEITRKNGGNAKIYEVYLNIKNPLVLDSKGYYSTTSYFDNNYDAIYDEYFNGDYDGIVIHNTDKSSDDAILCAVDNSTQIKSATDNIGTFDSSNKDIRYSQRDTAYLEAVNNGDMETAQRMVDEAAKEAGYTVKAYHGTRKADFTVFRRNVNYFSSSSDVAQSYAPNNEMHSVYLKMQNPFVFDAKNNKWSQIPVDNKLLKTLDNYGSSHFKENGAIRTTVADIVSAIEDGVDEGEFDYDGVVIKNVDDTGSYYTDKSSTIADDYIVFNRNNIKSADPVTYDDNGDVIPLSKRFNEKNEDIRYSNRITDDAVKYFGTTYSWSETGYLLTDGRRLDLSGKKYGARPGGRTQDHREVLDAYPEEEQDNLSGSEAMVDFMAKGNIRISPESDGINLSVLPTKAQENKLSDFISRAHGEVILDIDDTKGNTLVSVEYPYGTRASRILSDIKKYFEDGTEPYISDVQSFRYQARPDFSDILFDEFDGEVTDNDARLITEYIDGNADTISHILDKTKLITLSESKVKSLVSRMLSSYELSKDNQKSVYVAALSLLESTDRREVLDNLELLKTALTNTIQSSKLISEYDKSQKADVLDYLRDFRKEYSVYLNDEQISSLEFQGRSVSWLKRELFPLVSIVKEDSDSSKKKMSFGYFWHNISEVFPDIFDMDYTDSVDNWEIFLEKLNRIKNPPTLTVEEAFGISEGELVNELTGRLVADAVEAKYNSTKNAYVDTLIKNLRKKHNENVHKERIRITQKIKDSEQKKYDRLVKEHKKQRETYTENRNKTAVRNKIRNKIKQLDSYLNHGNKKKNVKEDMRAFVSRALETADIIFSNDISNEDILRRGVIGMSEKEQKYYDKCRQYLQMRESQEEMYAKARDKSNLEAMRTIQGKIDETNKQLRYNQSQIRDLFAREKAKLYEIPVVDALNNLADEYSKIEKSESSYVSNAYDEDVLAMINDLKEKIGDGTRARDMTLEQLVKVHDVYTAVLSAVRNANKLFLIDNSVSDAGEYIYEELDDVKKARTSESGSMRLIEKFSVDSLKPVYFFRMLGSKTFENLFWNLQKGELKWYQNVSLVKEFRKQMAEKYNLTSWDFESLETFTDVFGNEFSLSLEEKMSLCALYRREQGREHLLRDGFVFDENVKIKGKKKGFNVDRYHTDYKAHSMSVDIVMKIYATLTEEQKAYMEDMQKYLSTDMSNLGNEVSMKLYGIKQFKEAFYFPIKVSRKHLNTDPGKVDADAKLKSSGFTHNTVPKSGNPIVLSEFSTVWANHCNRMCQYNAFVLPLEDLTKVLNYRVSSANRGNSADALKAEISGRWGNGAVQYLEKLIGDLNGSVRNENIEIVDKLISLSKKGSVMASASVTIQQPFAMYRALSLISPKYYPKAMAKGLSFWHHNSEFEELKKYAPVAGIKEMGYFDVGIGQKTTDWMLQEEYQSKKEKFKAFWTDSSYRDDILSILPAKADEVAWLVIWRAVKSEIKDTTDLTGEEYLNRCGERFNEIIHLTQVYDSVLSRSGLMRNKDTTSKMVTAYMAEPTVTMNMMVDATIQAERIRKTEGFKVAAGRIARVYSTIAFTQVVTALAKSLVLAGRDDDEDETYLEKYISAASQEALQSLNPIGWIPLGRDVLSIIQGYDIKRTDMSLISDFVGSINDLNKTLSVDDSSVKEITEDSVAVISSFSNFFSVPVKNFLRDIDTAINIVKTFIYSKDVDINSYDVKEAVIEGVWKRSTKKVDRAKNAYDNGDMEVFHETISDMIQDKVDDGKTEKEAKSSVRSKFTSQCKSAYVRLYVDKRNISEANEIRKYLLATGLYGSLSELDKDLLSWRKDYMKNKK